MRGDELVERRRLDSDQVYNEKRVGANVAAIETLLKIEKEGRTATSGEQEELARYSGWGGLSKVFTDDPFGNWRRLRGSLLRLVPEDSDEYRQLRQSIQTAYYTSPEITEAIWRGVQRLGFEGGLVWEPAIGKGDFFGTMPEELRDRAQLFGTEMDSISARIARQLYQTASIENSPLQEAAYPDDFFDLAITNVPFGNTPVYDPEFEGTDRRFMAGSLHDYFIAKALTKVRPGGIVAVVTSRYTMDRVDSKRREWISAQADLLGAMRLPTSAFEKDNAQVTTDVLFLRKRLPGEEPVGEAWVESVPPRPGMSPEWKETQEYSINQYFTQNPDMVMGNTGRVRTGYGQSYAIEDDGRDLGQALRDANDKLPEGVARKGSLQERCPACKAFLSDGVCKNPRCVTNGARYQRATPPGLRNGSTVVGDDGALYVLGAQNAVEGDAEAQSVLTPLSTTGMGEKRARGMIKVRDVARRVLKMNVEGAEGEDLEKARKELNGVYDAFVAEFGPVSSRGNQLAFKHDPDMSLLLGLENVDPETGEVRKADIFSRRIIGRAEVPDSADNPKEALLISLAESGAINWPRMQQLTGLRADELQSALAGEVFLNPDGRRWEVAEEYLSGNVREKLARARTAARMDPRFVANAEALEEVLPADLSPKDIDLELGMGWLPPQTIWRFSRALYGEESEPDWKGLHYTYLPELGEWSWQKGSTRADYNIQLKNEWGTARYKPSEIFDATLNGKLLTVYDTVEEGDKKKRVLNTQETVAARAVQAKILKAFREWVWNDEDQAKRLLDIYNEKFNSYMPRQYDGSYLTFPGQSSQMFELRPHQKDATARIIQQAARGENVGLYHVVGAGKTAVMIASSMEMKRLGMRKKPMHCVPNHMLEQYAEDFCRQYPGANLLLVGSGDLSPKERETMMACIATGEWDAVIITHSAFSRIPVSAATEEAMLQRELDSLGAHLAALKSTNDGRSLSVRRMEKERDRLEAKIKKLQSKANKDDGLTWEELGVDHLYVDEADEVMANLSFHSRRQVSGLGNDRNNAKSFDLFTKAQYLNNRCKCGAFIGATGVCTRCGNRTEKTPGTLTLSTGTPVRNTLAQMYVFQKFMQSDLLQKMGLHHFDAWFSMFGRVVTQLEMNPSGKGWRMFSRVGQFANVGDLMRLWLQNADMQLEPEPLGLARPQIRGGEPERIDCPATDELLQFIDECDYRVNHLPDDPSKDNHLKVIHDATMAALDMRLVKRNAPDDPGSKINSVVDRALRIYQDTTGVQVDGIDGPQNMAQMIFLDTSTAPDTPSIPEGTLAMLVAAGVGRKQALDLADDIIGNGVADKKSLTKLLKRQRVGEDEADEIWRILNSQGFQAGRDRELIASRLQAGQADLVARELFRNRFLSQEELAQALSGYGLNAGQLQMARDMLWQDNFNLYDDMKMKFIAAGVPEEEIAYIHDATSDEAKLGLFDRVNRGQVRILIGSTAKMGAGTNAQRRLAALHHVDAPWRPRDIEQRNGRILRQGNLNKEVQILQYATERSFDVYRWATLERKARFAAQVLGGDLNVRSMEDVDEMVLNYTQMKAMATGNPIFMEQIEVDNSLRDLEALHRHYQERKLQARRNLNRIPTRIQAAQDEVARMRVAALAVDESKPLRIGDTQYERMNQSAAEALEDAIKDWRGRRGEEAKIGELFGCSLTVVGSPDKAVAPVVRINASQGVNLDVAMGHSTQGNITRLRNGFDYIGRRIQEQEALIARLQADAPQYEAVLRTPFEQEDDLIRTQQRAVAIQLEIERLQAEAAGGMAGNTAATSAQASTPAAQAASGSNGWGAGAGGVTTTGSASSNRPTTIPATIPQEATIQEVSFSVASRMHQGRVEEAFDHLLGSYAWNEKQTSFLETARHIVTSGNYPVGGGYVHPHLQKHGRLADLFSREEMKYVGNFMSQFRMPTMPDALKVRGPLPVGRNERAELVQRAFVAFGAHKDWDERQKSYINLARIFARDDRPVYYPDGGNQVRIHPAFERLDRFPFEGEDAELFHHFLRQFYDA